MRWLAMIGSAALVLPVIMGAVSHTRSLRQQQAAQELLQRANELESQQRPREAAELLEAYLALQPAADNQRVRLAMLYADGIEADEQREHGIALLYRAVGVCRNEERLSLQTRLGELLLTAGRFSEAEAQAAQVIQSRPHDPSALRVRALALLRQYKRGELDRTLARNMPIVAWLDEARRANPNNVELAELTAAAYRNLELGVSGRCSVASREQRADHCLNELVQASPQSAEAYLARYRYRLRLGRGDAIADLESALRHGPDYQPALLTASQSALRQGKFVLAAELYRRVINSRPQQSEAETYLEFGDALLASGARDEALDVWREGLVQHPGTQHQFHGRLADAHLAAGDWKAAEQYVTAIDAALWPEASAEGETLAIARDQGVRRGTLLMLRGRPEAAIEQFQRTITLQEQLGGCSPQTALAWRHLGELYSRSGQWNSAASAYDYACYEQPQDAGLWQLAAQAHLQANHADLAVERAQQALRHGSQAPAQAILASARRAQSLQAGTSGRQTWPTLAAVRDILPTQVDPNAASSCQLSFDAAVVLSQVQAQRGESALAQEYLLRAVPACSEAERIGIDRELMHHALSRGDVSEALTLLSRFVVEAPDNKPLWHLTAEVDLENTHRLREQEADASLP